MKSYTIHLIRHGICEGNLEGRYIGRTESPLADVGMQQILELKQTTTYPDAESFYASPSTRCVDTLRIIYPWAEPVVILEMAECDFGDWENKTAEELQKDPRFSEWMAQGQNAAPPNGESSMVFMQRVCKGFETLVSNMMFTGTTSAALVTHGGVIMTILAAYGLPRAKMTDWMCDPGYGYSIRITPSIWTKSMVGEVFQLLPIPNEKAEEELGPDNFFDI
ncbi:MAG: histidine phosphatase family protein [Clostridia bacterium]|nr:histidine phosphatase family protein [Clostridia bacterium]